MRRSGAWALVLSILVVAAWPADAQERCDKCEHICMWAQEIMSAQTTLDLYVILGPVAKDSDTLEELVDLNMRAWLKSEESQTPCWMAMAGKMEAGADFDRFLEYSQKSRPSGIRMRTNPLSPACPKEDVVQNLKNQTCAPLYRALEEHEKVHQETCRGVWDEAKTRFGNSGDIQAEASKGQWVINFWNNADNKATDEGRAYYVQLKMMRDSMRKLATANGCPVDTASITPPPSPNFLRKVYEQARMLSGKLKNARENPQ
jgi:hypothetical protein